MWNTLTSAQISNQQKLYQMLVLCSLIQFLRFSSCVFLLAMSDFISILWDFQACKGLTHNQHSLIWTHLVYLMLMRATLCRRNKAFYYGLMDQLVLCPQPQSMSFCVYVRLIKSPPPEPLLTRIIFIKPPLSRHPLWNISWHLMGWGL